MRLSSAGLLAALPNVPLVGAAFVAAVSLSLSPAAGQQRPGEAQPGQGPWAGPRDSGSAEITVRGRLETGVMAIGGETTGTTIDANGIAFELDLRNQPQLRRAAERFDGQRVLVEGQLHQRRSVERGQRLIIQVDRIEGLRAAQQPRDETRDWEELWDRYPQRGEPDFRRRNRGGFGFRGGPERDGRERDNRFGDRDNRFSDRDDRFGDGDNRFGDGDRRRERDDRNRPDQDRGDGDRDAPERRDGDDGDRRDGDRRDDDRNRVERSIRIDLGRLLDEALREIPELRSIRQ